MQFARWPRARCSPYPESSRWNESSSDAIPRSRQPFLPEIAAWLRSARHEGRRQANSMHYVDRIKIINLRALTLEHGTSRRERSGVHVDRS